MKQGDMKTEKNEANDKDSISDLVRKCFSAYELKDRRIIEDLLSDDFTFTSPLDDFARRTLRERIDRAEYFKRYAQCLKLRQFWRRSGWYSWFVSGYD
jgi:ketosteroid isomerase-like protein